MLSWWEYVLWNGDGISDASPGLPSEAVLLQPGNNISQHQGFLRRWAYREGQ